MGEETQASANSSCPAAGCPGGGQKEGSSHAPLSKVGRKKAESETGCCSTEDLDPRADTMLRGWVSSCRICGLAQLEVHRRLHTTYV
jgi:hypothetical protein